MLAHGNVLLPCGMSVLMSQLLFDNEAEGAAQTVLSNLRLFGTTPPAERSYYTYSRPRGC